ncbi:MAG: DUF4236 domain-containing protein, partial [Candidatus Geothermincolales bacterium]
MAFRIWKRVKLAPGVRLNVGKSGVSFSFGGRGLWLTLGGSGSRVTAGIPGTGIYWSKKVSTSRRRRPREVYAGAPSGPAAPLRPSLFRRLFLPP